MPKSLKSGEEIVPGYILVRRLGSGASGEVWVARASGGVHVAIKVLRDLEVMASGRELGALKIVREVKHPNLCPLFGVWFFDSDHNLLSAQETEAILCVGSDLTDTVCLSDDQTRDSSAEFDLHDIAKHDVAALQPDASTGTPGASTGTPDELETVDEDKTVIFARQTHPTQMVVAMGLGEQTLMDRLNQLRAESKAATREHADEAPPQFGIDTDELMRYMKSAASAIDELNEKHNIFHCDIKPQNILLVGGQAQVCDFGLARKVEDSRKTTIAFGTPAYGAPEMLFERTYSKTIDQYSLAVTYYELRTGKLPYQSVTQTALLRAKATGEVDLSRVSPAEAKVIARATDLDPMLRFKNCQAFVEALERALLNPDATGRRDAGFNRSWKLPAAMVAGLLVLGVTGWLILARQPADADFAKAVPLQQQRESTAISPALTGSRPSPSATEAQRGAIESPSKPSSDSVASAGIEPSNAEVASLVSAVHTAIEAEDKAALPALLENSRKLLRKARQSHGSGSPAVASLALTTLHAANSIASESGQPPAPDDVEAVRSLFDDLDRYADPTYSGAAATAIATSWIPVLSEGDWNRDLAEQDMRRAQQRIRGNQPPSEELTQALSAYLIALLTARRDASDLTELNAKTIRVAKPLARSTAWRPVAIAVSSLADPDSGADEIPAIDDQGAVPPVLPSSMHATYLLGAGWNCWIHGSQQRAVDRWKTVTRFPQLVADTAAADRHRAAKHLLDWLIRRSQVDDLESEKLRYAVNNSAFQSALNVVATLAVGDADLAGRIDRERFLCSVAKKDYPQAEQKWLALQRAEGTDAPLTPQLGRALYDLTEAQIEDARALDSNTINRLIAACNAQALEKWFSPLKQRPPDWRARHNELFERCFQPTIDRIRPQLEELNSASAIRTKVAQQIDPSSLGLFCDRFTALCVDTDRRARYDTVAGCLRDIELSAATAGRATLRRDRRTELFFYAADAAQRLLQERQFSRRDSEVLETLIRYANDAKRQGPTAHTDYVDGVAALEEAYRDIDPRGSVELNDRAIQKFADVIFSPSEVAKPLHGRAFSGRGVALQRKAIMLAGAEKMSLLKSALEDVRKGDELTPEGSQDREARLETLARVCAEATKISDELRNEKDPNDDDAFTHDEKLKLIVEATHAADEAIRIRQSLSLDDTPQQLAKLFVLGMRADVTRGTPQHSAAINDGREFIKKTEQLGLQTEFPRIQCSWHYNAALIMDAAGDHRNGLQHATKAWQIAEKHLEPSERLRHVIKLGYVLAKSNQLNPAKPRAENLALLAEIRELLTNIKGATPPIVNARDTYLQELERVEARFKN